MMANYPFDARNRRVECPFETDHGLLYVGIADSRICIKATAVIRFLRSIQK